nr:hypothetical protein [Klebsiella pneumoniae subsp. pneumoniae]
MGAAMAVPVFGRGFAGGRNKTPLRVFQVVGKKEKACFFLLCGYQPKINKLIFLVTFLAQSASSMKVRYLT